MKLNFEQKLVGIDGKNLFESIRAKRMVDGKEVEIEEKKDIILKDVCVAALTIALKDENPSAIEKMKRGELARKIYNAKGEYHINVEETSLVKELIGKLYGVVVVLAAFDLLDPKETKVEEGEKK